MELNYKSKPVIAPHVSDLKRSKLKAAQIRLLYAQSGIGSAGALLGAVVLGGALWDVIPHDRIVIWVLAYTALFLGRHCLIHFFHKQERDEDTVIMWGKWHSLAVTAGASLWGLAGVWLFPQASILHQFLLAIFVAGIAAAGVVIYSPTNDYAANPALALVPLAGRFIYEFDEFHVIVGGVILLFSGALLVTGRRMHKLYADSLRLGHDKEELLEDLKHEIDRRDALEAELKTARDDLEMQVEARTSELKNVNRTLEQEIVERKHIEEDLRKSEDKYRLLAENATDIVWTLDTGSLKFTYISPSIQKIRGFSPAELMELPLDKTMTPESHERAIAALVEELGRDSESGVQTDRTRLLEFREVCQDGSILDTEARIKFLRDENGAPIGLLGITRDITDRRKAEEALRKSEALLDSIIEQSPFSMWISDNEGTLIKINPACKKWVRVKDEDVIGKYNVLKDEAIEAQGFMPMVRRVFENGEQAAFELEWDSALVKHLGHEEAFKLLLSVTIFPVKDAEGIVTNAVCQHIDITERKQAEQFLQESEEKYRSVVENMQDVFYRTDMQGTITMISPSGPGIMGYESVDQIIGLNAARDFYKNPGERDRILTALREHEMVRDFEVELIRRDGTSIIVSTNSHIYYDTSGRPLGVEGVFTDITRRRKAEQALRESEEWHRSIVENSFDGIFVQQDGKIIFANSRLYQMLGYSPGELEGMEHWVVYYGKYQQITRERAEARMRGEKAPHQYEVMLQRKDGSFFEGEVSARVINLKGRPAVQSWVRDTAKRKRMEKVQRRLATAIEQSADAIVVTDAKGTVEYVNPAYERVTGYSREEVTGLSILLPEESGPKLELAQKFSDALTEGEPWSGRTVGQRKGGILYDTDLTISPVRDPNGRIVNFVVLQRDVTREVALQQQLLQSQKMEAIGTLAGGIAHDFNNLLTVVLGFSELLLAEKDHKHPEYEDLQKIFHAARNGADLVKRLLMFSRKSEPKPAPMSLNKQIVQVGKLLRRTIPRMIDIRLELSADLLDISADVSQMEQVLMNLAVNASDAMPGGGKLTVRTSAMTLDEEYCRLHVEANPGKYVLLEVSDTGQGMGKETLEHIFEPFFTTKEVGRGTGLGLAMVYGIVKQHNGHIAVDSAVGKGTTFKVYLPAIPAAAGPEVEDSNVIPAFGNETVLLVDDENSVRELGARILTKYGYTVLQAENGREALDIFLKNRSQVSLVILDLIMPEMGGMDCLRELLKIDPNVKILVSSGYSADASVSETIQMGAKSFVSKPFQVKDILRAVRRVLDEAAPHGALL